jgi:catechol 2,3-dioxygenase-like lactoylglutathione lyase family enzyme
MTLKITKFNHLTIAAPNGEHDKVIWFYEKFLGLKKLTPPKNLTASYDVWWYELGDKVLHVDFSPPFIKVPHNRHLCIEVEHLDDARKHFHSFDIETRADADVPHCIRFNVDDPFGNGIEVIEPIKEH